MHRATATRIYELTFPHSGRLRLTAGHPALLGIVNVTPDSFSDGGLFLDPKRAVQHALDLVEQGADLIDLGAESTRPGGGVYGSGAREVPADEEIARLLPVLERLRPLVPIAISVDTRKASVAHAALAAGADMINDVSGLSDPEMAIVLAAAGAPVILMHSRGELATMQSTISFRDAVAEVRSDLAALRDRALDAGLAPASILLDPGIGFGKTAEQSLRLIAATAELAELGVPIVVGASRKSFIAVVSAAEPALRLPGSLAAASAAAAGGAAMLRVHDVAETKQFLAVERALRDQEPA